MPDPRRRPRLARAGGAAVAATLALLAAGAVALALQGRGPQAEGPGPADAAGREELAGDGSASPSPQVRAPASPSIPPSPSPVPTGTFAPTPLPGPPPEGIEEIAAQVADLRGLLLEEPLDARLVRPAALGEKFADLAFSELDPLEIAADERLLAALRLIDPDVDLVGIVEALYREQILGLYAIEEDVLYIGGDDPALTDYQEITAAHEIVHVLQDRAFGLDALLETPDREADAALAYRALVEGDATLAQDQWSARHQPADARARAAQDARSRTSSAYASAPPYVRESISFPYQQGTAFVAALYAQGGWPAVDDAYADPPTTTRHILDPMSYLAREGAVTVTDVAGPGSGWEDGPVYTFGEFDLRHLLRPLGTERADTLAAGWRGGETSAWRRADDDAVSLALAFGSSEQAAAACEASPQWYRAVATGVRAEGPQALAAEAEAFAWACDGLEIRWGIAPDAATAERLARG